MTPLGAIYREAALPPIETALDSRIQSAAVRLHRLDAHHPLRYRAKRSPMTQTRFSRLNSLMPLQTEWTDPLILPP